MMPCCDEKMRATVCCSVSLGGEKTERISWDCFLEGKSQLLWSSAACTVPAIIPGWEVWLKWALGIIKSRGSLLGEDAQKEVNGSLADGN